MISERALKGLTDKLYFCTSLAPSNDPFGLTSAPSFTIAQQQPTFPPKRFDIFSPLTGGCSEGKGAVLVFIFVFAAFDPT